MITQDQHFFFLKEYIQRDGQRIPRFVSHLDESLEGTELVRVASKSYLQVNLPAEYCGNPQAPLARPPGESKAYFTTELAHLDPVWPTCHVFPSILDPPPARPDLIVEISGIYACPGFTLPLSLVNNKRFRLSWVELQNQWVYGDFTQGDVKIGVSSRGSRYWWPSAGLAISVWIQTHDPWELHHVFAYNLTPPPGEVNRDHATGFLPVHAYNLMTCEFADHSGRYGIVSVYLAPDETCPNHSFFVKCLHDASGPASVQLEFDGQLVGGGCDDEPNSWGGPSISSLVAQVVQPRILPAVAGYDADYLDVQTTYAAAELLASWCNPDTGTFYAAVANWTVHRRFDWIYDTSYVGAIVTMTIISFAIEGSILRRHPVAISVLFRAQYQSPFACMNQNILSNDIQDHEYGDFQCWDGQILTITPQ